jgi:carboxymethylenebutenolidase
LCRGRDEDRFDFPISGFAAPSPEQVNQHEGELKKHEFYRYDGAGHGIFYWHRPLYRPEQAMDGI